MTTNQKIWGKALLSSYKYLERLCNSLDELVEKTALNSYYSYSFRLEDNSIENIADKIISYSNRKISYINIKVLVEKVLKEINNQYAKLLILRFIYEMPPEEICDIFNLSSSAFYRRLDKALAVFMTTLSRFGYTCEKLEIEYATDIFISSVLRMIKKQNILIAEKANVISNDSVYGRFINDLMASVS